MEIEIDTNNILPVYEQIVQQVTRGVLSGRLTAGYRMPSVRQLASDLMLNPNTVAKAYRQLESQHVLLTAGRRGSFIHNKAVIHIAQNHSQDAQFQLDQLLTSFRVRGIPKADIYALLNQQLTQLEE